ncbi:MAG: hypothetical protein AAB646_02720 [Patescibacteria group bacterium]
MGKKIALKYFSVIFLFVIVILFYIGIFYFDAYNRSPWFYDLMLHFLGGVWVAGMAFSYLENGQKGIELIFLIMGSVALLGVAWELYEYVNFWIGIATLDPLEDILSDLFADLSGGTIFLLAYKAKEWMPFLSKK